MERLRSLAERLLEGKSALGVLRMAENVMPFLGMLVLGMLFGWVALTGLDAYLSNSVFLERSASELERLRTSHEQFSGGMGRTALKDFISANPFSVTRALPQKTKIHTETTDTDSEKKVTSVDGISVVGSLHDVGAWLKFEKEIVLVLKGQKFRGYILREVPGDSVIIERDGKEYIIYLSYRSLKKNSSRTIHSYSSSSVESKSRAEVRAPAHGGEGVISRETVNNMLMNPFNEMKKVRLMPKFQDGKPIGIEVGYLARDSILGDLGVQKGDVVQSVNGIPIRNMGDVANAINSLMGGERFEVAVLRNGDPVSLNYVVK